MTTRQPGYHAARRPDHPAVIMTGSGEVVTYAELETASNRLSHLLRARGLTPGCHGAVLLTNHPRYFEVVWALMRSGMYVTPINWHLGPSEAGYIIENCDAEVLIASADMSAVVSELEHHLRNVHTRLALDGHLPGFETLDDAVADQLGTPISEETEGSFMFYSSGTTGRPKGIRPALTDNPFGTGTALDTLLDGLYDFDETSRYLCPAPLYHAAPLGWSLSTQRLGGTVAVMERFNPEDALRAIEHHRITKAQFVPTHFVRMLKLPEAERTRHDTSSLETVIHAAAPCPVDVKQRMLDWWGPIIHEYYAGSEGNGFCAIGPDDWLQHPGSVGKPIIGSVHILNEEGADLGPGEDGQVWFESSVQFKYHKDPSKTAAAFNDRGWSSLGDVGHLDSEGYLYLTDRISNMIISGGVNIYPQEVEDLLTMHPAVADVAVIGIPDDEMGEQVKAIVRPAGMATDLVALERTLVEYCREHLAHYKCPRTVDFRESLPRLPTGKLLKRQLRDEYSSAVSPPSG